MLQIAAVVNSNGIKTHLANGLSTFFINGNPVFSNGPRSLPRNFPEYTILSTRVFDNFTLTDEFFAKALRSFETCLSVSINLRGKLFSSSELPIMFDEILKLLQ